MFPVRSLAALASVLLPASLFAQALPGTKLLESKADFARIMIDGIGKYLDRETAASVKNRAKYWKPDYSSAQAYATSVNPNRERFKRIIGLVEQRLPVNMEYVASPEQPALIAQTKLFKIYAVRWSVLPGLDAEGLLLEPAGKILANVVAVPDADQPPETWVFEQELNVPCQELASMLASNGCRVLVPMLINRADSFSGSARLKRWTNQPHREFVYRMAYQMGRHIIGYEVQKILAAVDWFSRDRSRPIGVCGYGEGGLLALYSAACDPRIEASLVSGYFKPRESIADEPIYRNVWSLLRHFGDAEIAALVAPRTLLIEGVSEPEIKGPPSPRSGKAGAAPGLLAGNVPGKLQGVEFKRARFFFAPLGASPPKLGFYAVGVLVGDSSAWTQGFLGALGRKDKARPLDPNPVKDPRKDFSAEDVQRRQVDQVVSYTQKLLPEAAAKRQEFYWNKLDTSSIEKFQKSQAPLREYFAKEIIGELPQPTKPMNPRTRQIYDTPKWTGYEVVLDLFDDVICYGILLVPKGLKPGEKRPVVVCQHGLEGRPTDVCNPHKRTQYYNSFGAQLADRGFIVFAPQNPYIFKNDFRQLVRKANPLGLTLYAFIVRQHERILDWLCTLSFVDSNRIAYYGLSYGGKVAMRIPILVGRYCVVICSGDFNEWIWKNITLDWGGSYMFGGEYEMFEFDLGNTFNYAEMAGLIAPRPFMVERGHDDPVGLDEYVAFEYAKVRRLYARLGIAERTEIEFFPGGHEIHGQGTFAFLHRHLNWPAPK